MIAGIAAVIVTIQANHLWGYNLAEQKQKKYNQTHEQEIKEHLQTLLDNGQYEEVYQLYTRLNQRMSGTGNSGWYDFYNMTEGYLRLRNAIMFYYNPELSEHYSKETTYISGILHGRVTGQPVGDGHIVVELCGIVLRKVGLGSGNTPFIISFIRFHFTN